MADDLMWVGPQLWDWTVRGHEVVDRSGVFVASVRGEVASGREEEAARLVAAAPDLARELLVLVDALKGDETAMHVAGRVESAERVLEGAGVGVDSWLRGRVRESGRARW